MQTLNYQIEFYSYWHIGSGISGGTYADSTVLKDSNGLPYIPGKTIKGLFREAASAIESYRPNKHQNRIVELFGSPGTQPELQSPSFFSDAKVSRIFVEQLLKEENAGLKQALYQVLSSTRIEHDSGTADKGSLRQLEVTVPLTLYGAISFDSVVDDHLIKVCAGWIKSLGINRSRGLGRCSISFHSNS